MTSYLWVVWDGREQCVALFPRRGIHVSKPGVRQVRKKVEFFSEGKELGVLGEKCEGP
jgi:hypothetical protein